MNSAGVLRGRRASVAAPARKQDSENDFLKVIAVDLSPLELRFENIFSRLAAIEQHLNLKNNHTGTNENNNSTEDTEQLAEVPEVTANQVNDLKNDDEPAIDLPAPTHKIYTDSVTLAQELESLRAAQLRLKINQELANSTLQLEMTKLRTELEQEVAENLQEFREEVVASSSESTKTLQLNHQKLAQTVKLTISEREVAENRWKSTFEDTIAARIQDIWSGMHSATRKLQESMQYLQTEMVSHEESSREMTTFVESIKASTERFDRDTKQHTKLLAEQEKDLEHLNGMCSQASMRLDEQDGKIASQVEMIYQRIGNSGASAQKHIEAYDAFVALTEKSFTALASDLTACNSTLTAHQMSIRGLDAVVHRHNDELIRSEERIGSTDAKFGSIDGRMALAEKKLTSTVGILQEHYQERQHIIATIQGSLNQAAVERTAIKHNASDLGFAVQEVRQKLLEVGKVADTTTSALARTAAEIPKIRTLVTTNSSNIAKNRQSIRDITTMIEDDRKTASTLRNDFDKEVADSVSRFSSAEQRDEEAQEAIASAACTTVNVKAELDTKILKNSNLLHQLNTMVDSLAITESTEGMEDKMTTFAVACAQLALKLEFFGRKVSSDGSCVMKSDVKASLAVLLTKVIRFLGSGVSIDQNHYLLTAKRSKAVDPITGQITMEIPPQHVLESFRIAKAAAFTTKTRTAMDQLQPIMKTNRTSMDFRDAFERKLRFVLEFGLANLFPNMGKPKNPLNRRGGEFGTCIACDRPMDTDNPPYDPEEEIPMRHRAQEPLVNSQSVDTVPEQRSTSPTARPSSAAMRNRIDTKTVVRGRSGTSTIRPKSGGDSVHNPPGTGDYVYRGGFRITKTNPNAMIMNASINTLFEKSDERTGDGPLDVDSSYLEKVALVGKHQVEISTVSPGAGSGTADIRAARPHTAPLRMKSLPRLGVTINVDNFHDATE
ncbi:hypothetical protein P3T76_008831 [Phytophthora citrophthora]|uniref:Uncharacterized protein n=1 Tax=Phytophthora citrophthora TaxID=4793 RepID=A0AAD9GHX1_9STRA|nr:hypothetical protein P3T76_008831 [Phytophthora citrophthora]